MPIHLSLALGRSLCFWIVKSRIFCELVHFFFILRGLRLADLPVRCTAAATLLAGRCGSADTTGRAGTALASMTAGAAAVSALTTDAGLAAGPAGPTIAALATDVSTGAAVTAVTTRAAVGAAAALTAQQS